jgi:hypothetical protein
MGSMKPSVQRSGMAHEAKILIISTKIRRLTYGQGEVCTDEAAR